MLTVGVRDDFARDDCGASAVEYGLLVAAVAAIIVAIVFALGLMTKQTYAETCNNFKNQASTTISDQADCS